MEYYEKALEVDNNETVLSNISITMLKLKKDRETIEYCDKCIEKVNSLLQNYQMNPNFKTLGINNNESIFLLKLYLRKSQAHLNLKELDPAF